MRHYLVKVAAAIFAMACMSSHATTVTISPSDDASLYTCNGCNVVSNGAYVLVAGYIQGAVKFPLSPMTGDITNALFSVNPYALPLFDLNLNVYGYSSPVGFIEASDANAGMFLGTWTLPANLGFGQDAFFNVTSFLASATGPYVAFNLRDSQGTDVFSSIEFNYGHPSQLLVTFASVPEPSGVGLLGLALGIAFLATVWHRPLAAARVDRAQKEK